MTSSGSRKRADAIAAAEGTCPRCGTPRDPAQRYCLECGLALPVVQGRLPRLRRRWIQRVGWYPGDWIWVSLLTLFVAILGAVAAIALTHQRASAGPTFVASAPVTTVSEPVLPTTTVTAPSTVNTATLPTAPEPTTTAPAKPAGPPNGRLAWPNQNGWTIVLVSYPKTNGRDAALSTATRAARAHLTQVGVLDSSRFASLQPGYWVVFTGVYGSKSDADGAVATARQAGFGGAYSRQIAR